MAAAWASRGAPPASSWGSPCPPPSSSGLSSAAIRSTPAPTRCVGARQRSRRSGRNWFGRDGSSRDREHCTGRRGDAERGSILRLSGRSQLDSRPPMFSLCSHHLNPPPGRSGMETTATILHADLDAFYASVEQLLDPSLRGKPIAVGGGVVLAASYEAKAFGVRGGMPGRQARALCPQLIFVGGHFEHYQRLGDAAIRVLDDFTPLVERISIDEAFADVAGCTHLFGSPADIAHAIRRRVRADLGLALSVGAARTQEPAQIGSQGAQTEGLVVVDPDTELQFLHR